MIRYYILIDGEQFQVMREGKRRGSHDCRTRAFESALFMATIDARRSGQRIEIFVEAADGRLLPERLVLPTDAIERTPSTAVAAPA